MRISVFLLRLSEVAHSTKVETNQSNQNLKTQVGLFQLSGFLGLWTQVGFRVGRGVGSSWCLANYSLPWNVWTLCKAPTFIVIHSASIC